MHHAPRKLAHAVSVLAVVAGMGTAAGLASSVVLPGVANAATVSSIDVRGNRRVDDATIRSYTGIQPGVSFGPGDIDEAVRQLFATGLFSDVRVNQVGGTLVVEVEEYATVNAVLFQGNDKLKDDQLTSTVQLKSRSTFSQATLDQDVEAINQAYNRIGRSNVTVTPAVNEVADGRVNVVFQINEGDRTEIESIEFVGNDAYSDRRLREVLTTKQSNFLSFLLRDDVFDENRLRADEERLRQFYYNRGYADFQIVSSRGELDPVANEYTVVIEVSEGERYTFGDVSIDTTITGIDTADLQSAIETEQGEVYSAEDVEQTLLQLTERAAAQGYAFAQVNPRGDRNFTDRTISIVYTVDQGPRTYIERIEIVGNNRTRDYVIRREFDVSEGDAFNQVLIQRAKRRLEALGFFETVEIGTEQGSEPDQVVLVVNVVEQPTGEFAVGGGYTTGGAGSGPSVELSVAERNFLGRGQFIKVSASGGKTARNYGLSFTEPYFLGRRISAGFDIYHRTANYTDYDSTSTGGSIRFGLPITQQLSTQFAYNLNVDDYDADDDCGDYNAVLQEFEGCDLSTYIARDIAEGNYVTSSVSAGLLFNTIDDLENPRSGFYATASAEFAGLGGDAEFYKLTTRGQYYQLLNEGLDLVGVLTAGAGYVGSFSGDTLRTFDLFRNSDRIIKGFEYNGIGPYDDNDDDHLGGTTYFHGGAEVQFPLPFVPDSFGFTGAAFAEAATLYGSPFEGEDGVVSTGSELRAAVGASIIWASPFGPLRVNYAVPIAEEETDDTEAFSFGVSGRF